MQGCHSTAGDRAQIAVSPCLFQGTKREAGACMASWWQCSLGLVLALAQDVAALVLGSAEGALHLVRGCVHGILGSVAALLQSILGILTTLHIHPPP